MAKSKKPVKRYPEEVRAQALDMLAQGSTMRTVSEKMGVSEQSLTNWKRAAGMTKPQKRKNVPKRAAKNETKPAAVRKQSAELGDLFQEYLAKEKELDAIKKAIAAQI